MARVQVTIPAAGKFTVVNITGKSIIVEQMNKYSEAAQVPTMDLVNGVSNYPLYNLSTYPNSEKFNKVKIYGTAESAGDTINLLSTDACLELDIKVAFAGQYEAEPGTTQQETLSDTVFTFDELSILNAEGKLPSAVYLACSDDVLRYAFNANPTQGAAGLGYELAAAVAATSGSKADQPVKIEGIAFILALRFINKTNLTDAELVYNFEY